MAERDGQEVSALFFSAFDIHNFFVDFDMLTMLVIVLSEMVCRKEKRVVLR